MMTNKENSAVETGGPAFPILPFMTLRDYFAAKALAGGVCFHQEDGCQRMPDEAAKMANEIADAMLAARKQGD